MRTKGAHVSPLRVLSNAAAFRILTALRVAGPQTTEQLADRLGDLPSSSLYRQLARLRESGVVRVVEERKARGAVERTYALGERGATTFEAHTIASEPIGALRDTVRNIATTLIADLTAFIDGRNFRNSAQRMLAATFSCSLTDEDYVAAAAGIQRAIADAKKRSENNPAATRRTFYAFALPTIEG